MIALRAAFFLAFPILVGGWGCMRLLQPQQKSLSELVAHSWLLGALLLTVSMGILGVFGMGAFFSIFILFLAAGIAVLVNSRPSPPVFARGWPSGFVEWGLCAVIVCQCFILWKFASGAALAWDGLVIWEAKARIASAHAFAIPSAYFSDAARQWSHPDYPIMLPLLETWLYRWIGGSNQSVVWTLFCCFHIAALLLLYSGVTEITGKRWAGLLTAALLFFVPFLTVGQFNLFTGYADFPLAVLYLAAAISFLRCLRTPRESRHAVLFAIYAGSLPWMKHEGAVLWVCLMLVAGVEFLTQRKIRLALLTALPGLVVIAAWKLVLVCINALPSQDFMPFTIKNLTANAGRIGTIAATLSHDLLSTNDWSILWILFPFALVALAVRGERRLSAVLGALVIIPLALYANVYILSSWASYEAHIDSSLPRLISQVSLVALLTLGIALPASRRNG